MCPLLLVLLAFAEWPSSLCCFLNLAQPIDSLTSTPYESRRDSTYIDASLTEVCLGFQATFVFGRIVVAALLKG
jgi:hypothetical protein